MDACSGIETLWDPWPELFTFTKLHNLPRPLKRTARDPTAAKRYRPHSWEMWDCLRRVTWSCTIPPVFATKQWPKNILNSPELQHGHGWRTKTRSNLSLVFYEAICLVLSASRPANGTGRGRIIGTDTARIVVQSPSYSIEGPQMNRCNTKLNPGLFKDGNGWHLILGVRD
jgi:hypothetical protein